MSYKTEIARKLSQFHVASPDKSNVGGYLADVYLWETVADLAEKKREEAWRALTSNKFVPPDDTLRETVDGESIVVRTPYFIVHAKVSNPRSIFDRDTFIQKVSEKFKISKPKLIELAAKCVSQTRAPLSKRVLEV